MKNFLHTTKELCGAGIERTSHKDMKKEYIRQYLRHF